MVKLDNVTIVGVAGTLAEETLKAIEYSCRRVQFYAAKLITPHDVRSEVCQIVNCEPLNYEQYNHFVVYRLHEYVDTDFILLAQNDGYVVNPDKWRDEFLSYDYVGAPWPMPYDDYSFRDSDGDLYRVGNGGFSLRSLKLLKLPTYLGLEWKQYYGNYHEDGFLCVHNRKALEKAGCSFAPIEVAKKFSHEIDVPETRGVIPFGFHGRNNYYYNVTRNKVMQ